MIVERPIGGFGNSLADLLCDCLRIALALEVEHFDEFNLCAAGRGDGFAVPVVSGVPETQTSNTGACVRAMIKPTPG